jgi:hypothetical protein
MAQRQITMEELQTAVRQQASEQLLRQLSGTISAKCYTLCIPRPGARLENADKSCLSKCAEHYLEVVSLVRDAYNSADV